MRRRRAWLEEGRRLALVGLVLLGAGLLTGRPAWALALALPVYLGWLVWDLARVVRWLERGGIEPPPDVTGVSDQVVTTFISERREAEREVEELTGRIERMYTALHVLPDAVVALDQDLRIVWGNEAAARLLGIRPSTDQGFPVDNLIRHPDFIRLLRGDRYAYPVTIPSPAVPEQLVQIRLVPYDRTRSVLIARDETEALRLERMRQDFIANVSHELRTPLTVLAGYVETMTDSAQDLPERWRRPTEAMSAQVQRMARLVDDLLLLSRIASVVRPPTREPVDVPGLVDQIVEEARMVSGSRQHVIRTAVDRSLVLHGSEPEIRTAFSNLVTNAVQHTPAGGAIDVRWRADAHDAYFEVVDSGEGIDPVHIPRLTERFYRVDSGRSRGRGGTGLGLAIVKHVLMHHAATLIIESQPGRGSRFACRFPLGEVAARDERPAAKAGSA